jgi:hypothetical protein
MKAVQGTGRDQLLHIGLHGGSTTAATALELHGGSTTAATALVLLVLLVLVLCRACYAAVLHHDALCIHEQAGQLKQHDEKESRSTAWWRLLFQD